MMKRTRFLVILAVCLLSLLPATDAIAQAVIRPLNNSDPVRNGTFGFAVAMDDADGDQRADIVVGDPLINSGTGRVYVFSGRTGALANVIESPNAAAAQDFGYSLAMGDVDGDHAADIAVSDPLEQVGANPNQGRVYVFSGKSGSILFVLDTPHIQQAQAANQFGHSIAMGDVDGDEKIDIVVGAPWERNEGADRVGRVYVFSGATGSLLTVLNGPAPEHDARFPSSLAVGDVDGDGRAEIIAGDSRDRIHSTIEDAVHVFSGVTGDLLFSLRSPNGQENDAFGREVATGDADGDGRDDILVAAILEDVTLGGITYQRLGRVYLYSSDTLSPLLVVDSPNPQSNVRFGWSIALTDVDNDRLSDVIVGADSEDIGRSHNQGRAYVFSGVSGELLLTLDRPAPKSAAGFGSAVAASLGPGHRLDIVVGSPADGLEDPGSAYLFSTRCRWNRANECRPHPSEIHRSNLGP